MDFACSSFSWETAEGLHLLGRAYDQVGGLGGNQAGLFPRGYPLPIEAAGGGLEVHRQTLGVLTNSPTICGSAPTCAIMRA